MKKICSKCKIEKPLSQFEKRKDSKDGYRQYCRDCKIELQKDMIVFDHKIPLCKNGKHEIDNIVICCSDCNHLKWDKSYEEFLLFLPTYINRFC